MGRFIGGKSQYGSPQPPLERLGSTELAELRTAARLFELLNRRAFFEHDVRHMLRTIDAAVGNTPSSSLTCIVYATLAVAIRDVCLDKMQNQTLAAEVTRHTEHFGSPFTDASIQRLTRSLSSTKVYKSDGMAASAVIDAILAHIKALSASGPHSEPLRVAAAAAHDNGLTSVLRKVVEVSGHGQHSPGYQALFAFYHGQTVEVRRDPARFTEMRSDYLIRFAKVGRSDPAASHVERIGRWINQNQSTGRASVLAQAARAAELGDQRAVALLYDGAVDEVDTLDQKATFRLISEMALLRSGQLDTPAAFRQSMTRLVGDHINKAKPLIPVHELLLDYCEGARRVDRRHPGHGLAAQVGDFLGDIRLGVALDHRHASLATATRSLTDLAVVDALQRDPEILNIEHLRSELPDASIVWIGASNENIPDDSDNSDTGHLHVTTLAATSTECAVAESKITPEQVRDVESAIGAESEAVDDGRLTWLSHHLFGHLTPENVGAGVYVIPDRDTWELPWARLLPEFVKQYSVMPSVASVLRLLPVPNVPTPRVLALFSDELDGTNSELHALQELHALGLLRLEQCHSFDELAMALTIGHYDLLCLSAHGFPSEGFEFVLDFGREQVPLIRLLALPLPPAISLACCWSARSPRSDTSVVASLGCLLAGASVVVGGLWELDDSATGWLLADAYRLYANGLGLPAALRRAFNDCPAEGRNVAAGICVFGRW